jgi:enoyl-CoA hydratase
MLRELAETFSSLEAEPDLRAVILTGAGEKAFSVGTDIAELAELDQAGALATSRRGQDLCDQLSSFHVPVISAVNGIAAGGGCELALACHLRLCSTNATFSLPETKLGVIPGYGGSQRLSREIGKGRALHLMLTGASLTAEEALQFGLVNKVSAPPELIRDSESLALEIAQLAPLAIRACLEAVNRGLELPLDEALTLESEIFSTLFNTRDMREGTKAFLEKRKPTFSGT